MITEEKLPTPKVGQRIECNEDFGTVKYIGQVEGYKGLWLGIDWDDSSRGKHNGTVNGKTYFHTWCETSGSFIRPGKINFGISLLESVKSRYGFIADENDLKHQEQQISNVEHLWNAPFLKLVGFDKITDKQSHYTDLTVLSARYQFINSLGAPGEFSNFCPNILELDLSKNLLSSWSELFQLCSEMVHLEWLKVSENKMEFPANVTISSKSLKTLICGEMNLNWDHLKAISDAFPNLTELIAPKNLVEEIQLDSEEEKLKQLEVLDLEENILTSWSSVNQLRNLPNLIKLNVSCMKIASIEVEKEGFARLQKLLLKANPISDWQSISSLNNLPKLHSLSLSNCGIYANETVAVVNQIIISMVKGLEFLNGSDIRPERKGAEIDYLKKFGTQWLTVKNNEIERMKFLNLHTRYLDLINVYGEMEAAELKEQPKTISDSLLQLVLNYNGKTIRKKVTPTMIVQKLLLLAKRLFNLADKITLFHVDDKMELELDESRELCFYSLKDGDNICVKII